MRCTRSSSGRPQSFTTTTSEFVTLLEDQRVKEMIDIVRETAGKEYIIFVDRRGRPVRRVTRPNLILNLDGLAKNLKSLGDWQGLDHLATAQQTLTEDDPRAALNSPKLYKLKDRFPIQIDLESQRHQGDLLPPSARQVPSRGEASSATLFDAAWPGAAPQHQAARRQVLRCRLRPRDLRQPLSLPAGPLRHPAAPAGRAGQVHRRHRPALGDQGDPGRPDRGRRRRARRWPISRWAGWPPPSPCTTHWRRTSGGPSPRSTRRSARC